MAYNASQFTITNKSLGIAQGIPTDARSWFYDATLFKSRPYTSLEEVLTHLNTASKRSGHFPIFINTTGVLDNGDIIGGSTEEWWFKDGVSNVHLVKKSGGNFLNNGTFSSLSAETYVITNEHAFGVSNHEDNAGYSSTDAGYDFNISNYGLHFGQWDFTEGFSVDTIFDIKPGDIYMYASGSGTDWLGNQQNWVDSEIALNSSGITIRSISGDIDISKLKSAPTNTALYAIVTTAAEGGLIYSKPYSEGSGDTFYSADGTLTESRIVTLDSNTVSFIDYPDSDFIMDIDSGAKALRVTAKRFGITNTLQVDGLFLDSFVSQDSTGNNTSISQDFDSISLSANANVATIASSINVAPNKILIKPHQGDFNIEMLNISASADDKMMVWDNVTKRVAYRELSGSTSVSKELYGVIQNSNTFADTSQYNINGATASVSANKIVLSGTAGPTLNKSLDYIYNSQLERWENKISFIITATDATFGIGLGMRSVNSSGPSNMAGSIYYDGTTTVLKINSGYSSELKSSLTIPNTDFKLNDSCELVVSRVIGFLSVSFRNLTTNKVYKLEYSLRPEASEIHHNTGRFAIYNFGGTYTISSHSVYSTEIVGSELMVVGDSKVAGSYVPYGTRFAELLDKHIDTVTISGGGGDRTTEVLARIDEIIALRPKQILLTIGCNDIRNGLTQAQYEQNYTDITNSLVAANIPVYHAYFYEGTETFQDEQVAWLKATYPSTYIDTYEQMKRYAGTTSGVHPSIFGNELIYNVVLKYLNPTGNLSSNPVFGSGISKVGDKVKLGGLLEEGTSIIDVPTNAYLKITTPATPSGWNNPTYGVSIGDKNYSKHIGGGTYDLQNKSALNLFQRLAGTGNNGMFLSMSSPDIPSANGWLLYNYGSSAGIATPRLITKATANVGYEHKVVLKSQNTSTTGYLIDVLQEADDNKFYDTTGVALTGGNLLTVTNRGAKQFHLTYNGIPYFKGLDDASGVAKTLTVNNGVLSVGSIPGSGNNIYDSNGTLSGDRIVTGNESALIFEELEAFDVYSNSIRFETSGDFIFQGGAFRIWDADFFWSLGRERSTRPTADFLHYLAFDETTREITYAPMSNMTENGIILKSPNGGLWKLTVANDGALITTNVTPATTTTTTTII